MKKILFTAFSIFANWNISQAQTGQALNFDGADDYVTIGTIISANSSYTKEAYVYVTNSQDNRNIISSLQNPFWISNNILMAGNGDTYDVVADAANFPLFTWTHVAVTYDALTATMTLYRNGVLVDQNTSAPAYVTNNELIGSHNGGSIFSGSMDEVRIWNRALSQIEIQKNAGYCGIASTAPGLLANYHFNQGIAGEMNTEETTLVDASDNGHQGTLLNFSLTGASSNWITPGAVSNIITYKDIRTSCGPFTWVDGVTYTASNNTASKTYTNVQGCDSVVILDLTLINLNDQPATVDQATLCSNNSTNITLASSQSGVKYYLRNDLNNTVVAGPFAGTGSMLTFNSGSIATSGKFNLLSKIGSEPSKALEFSGNEYNKYVNLGHTMNTVLEGTNSITVEAWVKRTEYGSLQTIVSNYQSGMQFLLRIDNDRAAFWVSNGNFNVANGNTILPVNTWMHLSGTWDGNTLKVFYNGVLDGATYQGGYFPYSSNDVKIGGGLNNGTEYFPGSIGDVRIWNVVRSESEINANQSSCYSGDEAGLLAFYSMTDGPSSNSLKDLTGHGYDGELINMDIDNDWIAGPPVSCAPICQLQLTTLLNLSVIPPSSGIDKKFACDSYTWIDENTYTSSNNTATHNIIGGAASGCDSLVTLDLTIHQSTTGTDKQTICGSYKWIDGITYTENNTTASKTLLSSTGCDSLVTLNLTIISMPDINVSSTTPIKCTNRLDIVNSDYSVKHVLYSLRDDADDKVVKTLLGTGKALSFDVTDRDISATYNLYAEKTSRSYLDFDGKADDVIVSNTTDIPTGNSNYTIEAMIKPDVYGARGIVGWGSWGEYNQTNAFRLSDDDYLVNYWWGNDLAVPAPGLTDGEWHHVAATFDGTTRSIYVDGILKGSDNPTGHDVTPYNLRIGSTLQSELFDGGIDEVRIWNVGKTQEELIASMDQSLTGTEEGLVVYYTFDDGKGSSVLTDKAGIENTGVLNKMDINSSWIAGGEICANEMSTTASITVVHHNVGTDVQSACDSYTWIDGVTYTASNNTATFKLVNKGGCDSIVTLNLTIGTLDNTTNAEGNTITANETGATYQWLDCNNGNLPIAGATNQSFTSSENGSYAVSLNKGVCNVTSNCVKILITTVKEDYLNSGIKLFPNPTNDHLTIDLGSNSGLVKYSILSVEGITVLEGKTTENIVKLNLKVVSDGLYFLRIDKGEHIDTYKIIKQ